MPRKAGKRKKNRTHAGKQGLLQGKETEERGAIGDNVHDDNIPRTLVARSFKVSTSVGDLIKDVRKMMSPHTASNLRERSYNRVKDYASVASQLGITHLLSFSQTKNKNVVMRIARFHQGPTLHFRIRGYSLSRHIRDLQKRPFDSAAAFNTPPLVVLNNFGNAQESHLKLLRLTLQGLFPSINVNTVHLNECRRVVLFHYKKDDSTVEMRHYAIKANPVGINKNIKKILQCKIPNLGNLKDVSELLDENHTLAGGYSDSEAEDDESTKVELSERYVGSGNGPTQKSAMKLIELGPRMCLELFKVERGMCEGDIMYHKFEEKTPEEAAKLKKKADDARKLKEERRRIQQENVLRKKREREAHDNEGGGRLDKHARRETDSEGSESIHEDEDDDEDVSASSNDEMNTDDESD